MRTRRLAILAAALAAFLVLAGGVSARAPKGSRSNPYPVKTWAALPGGWKLRVNRSIPDATKLVVAASPSNAHPRPGKQYYLANLSLKYAGKGASAVFSAYTLSAVGHLGLAYTPLDDDCGVVPKALDDFERVRAGQLVTGNVCYDILETDAGVLRLVHRASPKATPVFFRLH